MAAPTPETGSKKDADRLCSAVNALLGDDTCKTFKEVLEIILAGGIANPTIFDPPDGALVPECEELRVLIQTNRPDLHYDVMLYHLPDTTNAIFGYTYLPGAPYFGVICPATDFFGNCLLEDGEAYQIKVQVNLYPWLHNTSTVTITAISGFPVYYAVTTLEKSVEAVTNGTAKKPATMAVMKSTGFPVKILKPKMPHKAPAKSKK